MKPVRFTIAEGITLDVIQTDQFKTAQLSVNFLYPISEQSASMNALLPSVLKRGCVTCPDMTSISKRLQELYDSSISSTNYKRGEIQIFGLSASFIESRYALDETDIAKGTCDLLKDLLFHPVTENGTFRPDYVESEKNNLMDRIRADINNKSRYALLRCYEEMCKGEVYAVKARGTLEGVGAITPLSLTAHYHSILRTAPISVCYVGSDSPANVKDLVAGIFDGIGERCPVSLGTEVLRQSPRDPQTVTEEESVTQAKLVIGFRSGKILRDPDYIKMMVFNEVLGGSTTSKLFMNVREKLSLCYFCQTLLEHTKGLLCIISGVEQDKVDAAKDEIFAQIDAIRNGDITDEEYDCAVRSLANQYRALSDSPDSLESWYLGRMLADRSESPEDAIRSLSDVRKDDLREIAEGLSLDTTFLLLPDGTAGDEEEGGPVDA